MAKKYERPWYGLTEGPKVVESVSLRAQQKIIITVKKINKNTYIRKQIK